MSLTIPILDAVFLFAHTAPLDTSANLVFADPDIALEALTSLSVTFNSSLPHNLQLRSAKPSSAHPSLDLQVRIATTTDRKPLRAHARSRFYMMHPEHDPREHRRQDSSTPRTNNSRRSDRSSRRRRSVERNRFDESLYDDTSEARNRATAPRAHHRRSRRGSRSSISSNLHSSRSDSRARDRSASPTRANNARRTDRRRTPPPMRHSRTNPNPATQRENLGKELFPNGAPSSSTTTSNKAAASTIKKELFPHLKSRSHPSSSSFHRRTQSIDVTHDTNTTTSEALASSLATKMVTPLVDGVGSDEASSFPLRSDGMRVKNTSTSTDTRSRTVASSNVGFNIRGTASMNSSQGIGFTIRGTAEQRVKELFPVKVGNKGKELFANKNKGMERKRADMFY